MTERHNWRIHLAAVGLWLAATAGAYLARQAGQPLTAALFYLCGVTLIGAVQGLRGGVLAAIASSLFYNFFLSDPLFRFSFRSADEYVPLIAFTASAGASGLLAGRLRDRALAAEAATRRVRALLDVSTRLQGAIHVDDLPEALSPFPALAPVELHVAQAKDPVSVGTVAPGGVALARRAWTEGIDPSDGDRQAWRLCTASGISGVLITRASAGRPELERDVEAVINLLSFALERWLLRERLSEAELIRRSEALKTALLSSVSHDLRTPLSAIAASASSLEEYGAQLSEETRAELLQMIREQCDRLNRYTTNLLNLGRIHAGVDQRQFTLCDALEVLGAALSSIRTKAGAREFRKEYHEISEALVRADPVMLEQVFFNILDNAIRYSPDGSPILIAARVEAGHLQVSIADSGPGIAAEDLPRVFDPFWRSTSTRASEGNGLGLSIASGFTQAFGGSIEALRGNPPFAGACIRISLPIEPARVAAA